MTLLCRTLLLLALLFVVSGNVIAVRKIEAPKPLLYGTYGSTDGVFVFRPDGVFGYKLVSKLAASVFSQGKLPPFTGRYEVDSVGNVTLHIDNKSGGLGDGSGGKITIQDEGRSFVLMRRDAHGKWTQRDTYTRVSTD